MLKQSLSASIVVLSSHVTFNSVVLYTTDIVSTQVHGNRQENNSINVTKFFNYEMNQLYRRQQNHYVYSMKFNDSVSVVISYETHSEKAALQNPIVSLCSSTQFSSDHVISSSSYETTCSSSFVIRKCIIVQNFRIGFLFNS